MARQHDNNGEKGFRLLGIRITPSLVLAMIALFAALSTSGYAAQIVPLAKRALTADKAKTANTAKLANLAKVANTARSADTAATAQTANVAVDAQALGGLTAAQIAAMPGPANALSASLFTVRTDSFELSQEGQIVGVTVNCQAGERAIAGGWAQEDGAAYVLQDSPTANSTGWRFVVWGASGNNLAAVGTIYAICAKVS
jgi:hypothetical protein